MLDRVATAWEEGAWESLGSERGLRSRPFPAPRAPGPAPKCARPKHACGHAAFTPGLGGAETLNPRPLRKILPIGANGQKPRPMRRKELPPWPYPLRQHKNRRS